jgi:hypothetical protein
MSQQRGWGNWAARIAGWGRAIVEEAVVVAALVTHYGYVGGLQAVLRGRTEVFESVQRRGTLDTLPGNQRPGNNMYVKTDMQLSRAMKADFDISYLDPETGRRKMFTRSMLFNADRTKGAIMTEFERRLQEDMSTAGAESAIAGVTILSIDFVGLQQRSDVEYEWEPDDAPW